MIENSRGSSLTKLPRQIADVVHYVLALDFTLLSSSRNAITAVFSFIGSRDLVKKGRGFPRERGRAYR